MASTGKPTAWMKKLNKRSMENEPGEEGYIYVDGHVRAYNGDAGSPAALTKQPGESVVIPSHNTAVFS